jgi:hypothetical protein
MRDCFASLHPLEPDDGTRWANLFDALLGVRPKNLTRIEVLIEKREIDYDHLFCEDVDNDVYGLQWMKELLEEDRDAHGERKRDGTGDEGRGAVDRRRRGKRTLFLYAIRVLNKLRRTPMRCMLYGNCTPVRWPMEEARI